MKIQALHIVNQSWVFDIVFNIFKPLLDDRMKERIFFHGQDYESLHQHIDPKYLPERYGGIHPDYNYNDWIDGFRRNGKIIKEMRQLGYKIDDSELFLSEEELKEARVDWCYSVCEDDCCFFVSCLGLKQGPSI